VKGVLRTIAGGLKGVGYNSLASDLEGVTYSSLRQGAIDERDNYKVLQQWFIDSCVNPVFESWLRCLLTLSQYKYEFKYRNDFKYYNQPYWYPKRWQWVDPEKETNAALLAINNNLKTYGMLAAEMGYDFYEIVEQRAQEEELLKKFGLKKNMITENPKKPDNTTDKEDKEDKEEDELDKMDNPNPNHNKGKEQ
jgi:lambda family phage portal protein